MGGFFFDDFVFGDEDFFDHKLSARQQILVERIALWAISFICDNVEDFTAIATFCHTRHDVEFQLRVFEIRLFVDSGRPTFVKVNGDNAAQFTDLQNYGVNGGEILLHRHLFHHFYDFKNYTEFVHKSVLILGDRLGDDSANALDCVFCHFERQFLIHFCHNGLVVSDELDRVKLTLGGALTATDAHVGVHFCRAATETTSGFRFHLLFGERCSRILERTVVFFDVQRTLTFDGVITAEFEIALVEFDIDSSVSAVLLSLSRPHCSMQ